MKIFSRSIYQVRNPEWISGQNLSTHCDHWITE